MSTVRESLVGSAGAPEKNEFEIGGDAISCCFQGLSCTLQSLLGRYSITYSIHSTAQQIWTNYETWYFQRMWRSIPRPLMPLWLRRCVALLSLKSCTPSPG